jgi:hypothetical protein
VRGKREQGERGAWRFGNNKLLFNNLVEGRRPKEEARRLEKSY